MTGPVGLVTDLGLALQVRRIYRNVLDSKWHGQIPVPLTKTTLA